MVPFPRLHFFSVGFAPLVRPAPCCPPPPPRFPLAYFSRNPHRIRTHTTAVLRRMEALSLTPARSATGPAFLTDMLCFPRLPHPDRRRAHTASLRREEHDVRLGSPPRPVRIWAKGQGRMGGGGCLCFLKTRKAESFLISFSATGFIFTFSLHMYLLVAS